LSYDIEAAKQVEEKMRAILQKYNVKDEPIQVAQPVDTGVGEIVQRFTDSQPQARKPNPPRKKAA